VVVTVEQVETFAVIIIVLIAVIEPSEDYWVNNVYQIVVY